MRDFNKENNMLVDTLLGIAHVRSIQEFFFNAFITTCTLIFGYFNSLFLENVNLFTAVLIVVAVDNFLGQIIAIKTKKYNKRLKRFTTSWETQKAIKGIYYLVGYSAIVAVVLSIQKGFSGASFLDEAVILPILIFQLISILKNASLLHIIPQGLLLQILENIDNYKDNTIATIKEEAIEVDLTEKESLK